MTDNPAEPPAPHDLLQGAVADLGTLDGTDLRDQVPIYERLHVALEAALAGTVDQPAAAPEER